MEDEPESRSSCACRLDHAGAVGQHRLVGSGAADVAGWVYEYNLQAFVEVLSTLARYDYGADDAAAVEVGVGRTDGDGGTWFTYPLCGEEDYTLALARDVGTSVVLVRVGVPASAVPRVEMAMQIAQTYRLVRPGATGPAAP
jgi:hypothetical protein